MSGIPLPGFQVLDTLRQTSKTITVKAVQSSLERTVALTFLRHEPAANPHEVQRFLGVARVCAQIKADGLPQIYDVSSHGDQHYIVMEYVEGLTVAEIVQRDGPMSVAQSLRIAITVADALRHAWEQSRLVHRNLKPSEIRINDRGTPKLTDFGRATIVLPNGHPADEEDPGVIVGTPNFLSPEQVQGNAGLDCRADIYALGATLYYMITGRVPFPDSDPETVVQKQLTDQIPHPRTFRPDLAASISGLITRLMMKVPDDRYADWTETMGDMQLALKNQPLRRRETPPKGISTVASVTSMIDAPPAPELPQLRKVNFPAADATPTAPFAGAPIVMRGPPAATTPATRAAGATPVVNTKPRGTGLSSFVRIVLWILLGIWFALLGNDRLGNPLVLPLPSPLLPLDKWLGTPPATPTPVPPPSVADTQPPIAPPVAPAVLPPPPAIAKPEVPAAATAPAAKPVEPEKPRVPQTLPSDIATRLTDALARADLAGARAILAAKISIDPARLSEYRSAVAAIPDPLQLAEDTLRASKGQEMTISYLGKDRKIIPRNIAEGEIQADFVTADGNRPVTFKTAKFTPEELLMLLPQQPETPAVHAAICLVLLKANHKADIAAHVPYCGVLGPLFAAAATAP
jgi:serine/threonine protein kinase